MRSICRSDLYGRLDREAICTRNLHGHVRRRRVAATLVSRDAFRPSIPSTTEVETTDRSAIYLRNHLTSSTDNSIPTAPKASRKCSTFVVPKIGTTRAGCANNQAKAT
jgi:hypothetical protein